MRLKTSRGAVQVALACAALAMLGAPAGASARDPGPPSAVLIEGGDLQTAVVGHAFTLPLKAKVTDGSGFPVPDVAVKFTVAATPASGTFAGGEEDVTATTNAGGIAVSSVLTANHVAGPWVATASLPGFPGVAAAQFSLANLPEVAASIALELDPESIKANGTATTDATATVEDAYGNGVSSETVTILSDGAQSIGPVVDDGDGRYEAQITSSGVIGDSTITAADGILVATANLNEHETVAPIAKITSGARGKTRKAHIKMRFGSTDEDLAYFQCRLDGGAWARCRSPKRWEVRVGAHVFRVRAIDLVGNVGPSAARHFRRTRH